MSPTSKKEGHCDSMFCNCTLYIPCISLFSVVELFALRHHLLITYFVTIHLVHLHLFTLLNIVHLKHSSASTLVCWKYPQKLTDEDEDNNVDQKEDLDEKEGDGYDEKEGEDAEEDEEHDDDVDVDDDQLQATEIVRKQKKKNSCRYEENGGTGRDAL